MLHFADVFEAIATTVPGAPAISQGDRVLSWGDYDEQAARLADAFAARGLGTGSHVGMFMYNAPEYLVTQYAAFKERITPINVNYRYLDDELAYLLDNSDCAAVVYHSSLGDRLARIVDRLPKLTWWISVDDGPAPGGVEVDGAEAFATVLAGHRPAPPRARAVDDLYMLYTGGTTGMPKGVMYEVGQFTESFLGYVSVGAGRAPFTSVVEVADFVAATVAAGGQQVATPACPLMHGTGVWLGALLPHLGGGEVALLASRSFDAHELWSVVERRGVGMLVIVGDAFGRPMLQALRERAGDGGGYDTGSVTVYVSTGAMLSTATKEGLLEFTPGAVIMDVLGSTEGGMAQQIAVKGAVGATASFATLPTTKVFGPDDREVAPGSGEIGIVAVAGTSIPLGYYKDEEKTARTFRTIDGVRYSFPGDMATVAADGSIALLGRGSNCINTAGEKVFPEEVEEVVKTHPAVADCLVFGVDDERFGQRVVGVFSVAPHVDAAPTGDEVIAHAKAKLSSYKVPKQVVAVDAVPRAPNGKADYATARRLFRD
ncbi:MAG: AMP-binding protein [Acidimicrobiia bacterium]|nr:AMP-binding protein [Acidimicrobiia bacterium]